MSLVLDEDQAFVQGEWLKATVLRIRSTFEARIRGKWYHEQSDSWKCVWILVTLNQEEYEDGTLKSIMGVDSSMEAIQIITVRRSSNTGSPWNC